MVRKWCQNDQKWTPHGANIGPESDEKSIRKLDRKLIAKNTENWRSERPEIEKDRKFEARRSSTRYFGAGPAECAEPAEALELVKFSRCCSVRLRPETGAADSKRGARIPPCLFNDLSLVVVVWSLGGEDHRIENRFKKLRMAIEMLQNVLGRQLD